MSALDKIIETGQNDTVDNLSAPELFVYLAWIRNNYVKTEKLEQAAAELAAMREAIAAALELAKQAQMQLQSSQVNWGEDCFFRCDDFLDGVIAKLEGVK